MGVVATTDRRIASAVRAAVAELGGTVEELDVAGALAARPGVVVVDDETTVETLRARDALLPVMLVTTPGDAEQRIRGLLAGADDAVPSDVVRGQMAARVHALSRRGNLAPREPEVIAIAGCEIDLGAARCARDGVSAVLTAKEVAILRWLYRHRGRAVSRAELLEHVWGASPDMITKTVDVTIHNLRKKLELEPSRPRIIRSVKGVGYLLG